jgi:nucleoside-diphosphate-sugar epimerase
VRRLCAAGIEARGTSLSGTAVAGAEIAAVDLRGEAPLDFAAAAGAVVYYMVSTLARVEDGSHRPPLQRALAALDAHPVAGLIYVSSTTVYGDRGGDWVDEHTPVAPTSPWGRMRVELEQMIWDYGRRRALPACVVRLPEIYGPDRGVVARLRQGAEPALRFADRYSNRIHVDDLADVLLELGRRLDRELLLVSDGHPATTEEVYREAARLLGLPPPRAVDAAPAGADEPDANRLALLRDSKRCRNDELLRWLGRPLRYPDYRQGLTACIGPQEASIRASRTTSRRGT